MSELEIERVNGVPVVRHRGDIDAANAGHVRERMTTGMGNDATRIVIDLSDTRYLDSAGIDMLLRFNEHLRERRAKVLLVIPENSPLLSLARLAGLSRAIDVCATVERALAGDPSAAGGSVGGLASPS